MLIARLIFVAETNFKNWHIGKLLGNTLNMIKLFYKRCIRQSPAPIEGRGMTY